MADNFWRDRVNLQISTQTGIYRAFIKNYFAIKILEHRQNLQMFSEKIRDFKVLRSEFTC